VSGPLLLLLLPAAAAKLHTKQALNAEATN
jgi:hypothetical protein